MATMAPPPPRRAPSEHTNGTAAAAFRVVLTHLRGGAAACTERQLARAACVCAAWRDEAGAPEHHAVMRFTSPAGAPPVSRDVVARVLVRHADAVTELHATFLLRNLGAALPPGAHFPRLARVVERCTPPASAAVLRTMPQLLNLIRAAPRLAHWLTGEETAAARTDCLPSALAGAAAAAADAEARTLPWPLAARGIVTAAASLHGLFTPSRTAAAMRVHDRALPPGAAGLLRLLTHAAQRGAGSPSYDPDALKHLWWENDAPQIDHDDGEDDGDAHASALAGFDYIMGRLAAQSGKSEEALSEAADFTRHPRSAAAALGEVLRQPRVARTLLHAAVERASVALVAVLLRHGADPLQGGDDNALARCTLDTCELIRYAELAQPRDGSPSMAALHAAAEEQLAVYWLLARAAAARHGSEAIARRLPPVMLALATMPAPMRFLRTTRLTRAPRGADGAPTPLAS
jgi:hypothetical protein